MSMTGTEQSPRDEESQSTQVFTQPPSMDATPTWGTPSAPPTSPALTPAATVATATTTPRVAPENATESEPVTLAASTTTPVPAITTHAESRGSEKEQQPPESQVTTASMAVDAEHDQGGPFTPIDLADRSAERHIAMGVATEASSSTKQVSIPSGDSLIDDDDQTLPNTTPPTNVSVNVEESADAASGTNNDQVPLPTSEPDNQHQEQTETPQIEGDDQDLGSSSPMSSDEQSEASAAARIGNPFMIDMCEWWCAVALHCDLEEVEEYMKKVADWLHGLIGSVPKRGRVALRWQAVKLWHRFVEAYFNLIDQLNSDEGDREILLMQPEIWNDLLKQMDKIQRTLLEPDANKWTSPGQDEVVQEAQPMEVDDEDQSDGAEKTGDESADDESKTQDKVEKEKRRLQELAQNDCFQKDYDNVKQHLQIQIALAGLVSLIYSYKDEEASHASIPVVLKHCQNCLKNVFNKRRDDHSEALFDPLKHVPIELRTLYSARPGEIENPKSREVLLGLVENIHKKTNSHYSIASTIRHVQALIQDWCQQVLTAPALVQCGYHNFLPVPKWTINGTSNEKVDLPTSHKGRRSTSQRKHNLRKRNGTITHKDDDIMDSDGMLLNKKISSKDNDDDDVEFEPQNGLETNNDELRLTNGQPKVVVQQHEAAGAVLHSSSGEEERIRDEVAGQKDHQRNRRLINIESVSQVHNLKSTSVRNQGQKRRSSRSSEQEDTRPRPTQKSGRNIAAGPRPNSAAEDEESSSRASSVTFLSGSDEDVEDDVVDQAVASHGSTKRLANKASNQAKQSGPNSDISDDETWTNPPLPSAPGLTSPPAGGSSYVAHDNRLSEKRKPDKSPTVAEGKEDAKGNDDDIDSRSNSQKQKASKKRSIPSDYVVVIEDSDSESETSRTPEPQTPRRKMGRRTLIDAETPASSRKNSRTSDRSVTLDDSDNESKRSGPPKSQTPQKAFASPRRRFTEAETSAIIEGIRRFGFGKWKETKDHYSEALRDRSTVQIKDKARTLREAGAVDVLPAPNAV